MSDASGVPVETVELEIADVAYRGRGVGRLPDGCAVFVPDVLKGERVRVAITRRHRRYAEARLLEVLMPSAARCEPACPLAGNCPGCAYQHVVYDEEVRLKQDQLVSVLTRLGREVSVTPAPPTASPSALGYRNKIVLHEAFVSSTEACPPLGYVGEDNRTVLDVPCCPIAQPLINEVLAEVREGPRTAEDGGGHGRRSLTLRGTETDGVVAWWDAPPPSAPHLTEQTALGPLRVPLGAFFQVNPAVADAVTAHVMRLVRDLAPPAVVDLYCGVGVFALAAARVGVPDVRGIDIDRHAIRAARRNAQALGVEGVSFSAGPAEQLAAVAGEAVSGSAAVLILDPPRGGLTGAVRSALAAWRPRELLYVSCAADTLARDIAELRAGGYSLADVRLFDMFPRTPYFETVAWLRRDGGGDLPQRPAVSVTGTY